MERPHPASVETAEGICGGPTQNAPVSDAEELSVEPVGSVVPLLVLLRSGDGT
ncbi:hypothetical protein [Arthrobacter sp. AFG20]|uniref:hypothetical protein n=1 Tax=Arthrobacter sp. AFG20 TaxID=1688671 RepID=UPI0015E09ECB|nr:hypothetical protein [Arthrobacter sp. AFG20]